MRSLKMFEAGKRNETLWQIIHDNMRYPDASLGRFARANGVVPARRQALCELSARYGRETVEPASTRSGIRRIVRAAPWSKGIPDGDYYG